MNENSNRKKESINELNKQLAIDNATYDQKKERIDITQDRGEKHCEVESH